MQASWELESLFSKDGDLQKMTSNIKIFTARQTMKQTRSHFRPTLLAILEEGEIHSHHMEVKLLIKMELIINKILDNYLLSSTHVSNFIYLP